MTRQVSLEIQFEGQRVLRLSASRAASVGDVLSAIGGVVGGFGGRRLDLYYGNSKLRPETTLEFYLLAYRAADRSPVPLRIEALDGGDGDAPPQSPGGNAGEVVLFEEDVTPTRGLPPIEAQIDPGAPPRESSRVLASRIRPSDRTYRVEVRAPSRLALGRIHSLNVRLRALSEFPTHLSIEIVPRWPGCLVAPERVSWNGSAPGGSFDFVITALAAGKLAGASIELGSAKGPRARLATPATARSASAGWVLLALGTLVPAAAFWASRGSAWILGGGIATVLAGLAALLAARPRSAPPREETIVL